MPEHITPEELIKIREIVDNQKNLKHSPTISSASGKDSDIEMIRTQIGFIGKIVGCAPHSIINVLFCSILMMVLLSLILFFFNERDALISLVMPGLLSFIGYLFGFYTASNMKDK